MKKNLLLFSIITFSLSICGCDEETIESPIQETDNDNSNNESNIVEQFFTITWKNYDDSELGKVTVKQGETPSYTYETPTKPSTSDKSYTFSGWNPQISAATQDMTYVATFSEHDIIPTYTITWKDYDGTIIETSTVEKGKVPACSKTPNRESSDDKVYTFESWEPEVKAAKEDITYTATYSERIIPKPVEKVSTIAEVKELCSTLSNLNSAGIEVGTTMVKIQGWAFHKTSLVKTTKKFGYDLSYPNKVFLGDSTGFIACASNNTDHSLYKKLADYAGNAKSKYEVTGYISMYLNQPELYVPDNCDEFTYFKYDENLTVNCNVDSFAINKTLEQYYDLFDEKFYNCAGHGYKDIVKINNVSILDVVDSDTYIGTDGNRVIKVKKGLCSLAKNHVYNLIGLVQINDFIPSINLLKTSNSEGEFTYINESSAKLKTITSFINEFSSIPYEDTNTNLKDTIKKFQYVYKTFGYVSAYQTNGKLYVTLEPSYNNASQYPTKETAIGSRDAIVFRNDNCWNVTEDEIIKFSCVGDFLNENCDAELYITPILYENMTYNKVKHHMLKNYVFEQLVPEFIIDND